MALLEVLGYLAGALTTIAFLPQVIKIWKTRSTKDISLGMFSIFCTGVLMWAIYGLLLGAWPVVVANVVTLVLSMTILIFKVRYG